MTLCATILRWTDSTVSSWMPTSEPATCASTTHWTTGGQRNAAVRLLSLHFSSVKQPKHKHEQNEHLQKCELILFSIIFKSKKCFIVFGVKLSAPSFHGSCGEFISMFLESLSILKIIIKSFFKDFSLFSAVSLSWLFSYLVSFSVCLSASPQALCQDQICSAHEFCGDKANGGTGCFCRAIYAAPYRSTDSLGTTAVEQRDLCRFLILRGWKVFSKGELFHTAELLWSCW